MNENRNKRRIVLTLILVATITISILATTAYFITQGRVVEQRLTVKTGTLALTFEDNDDGVNEQLMLGESVTKEFIIHNTGNQPVTTNMLFDSLVNTYLEESLSYKLEYKTSETGDWASVTTTSHTHIPYSPNMGTYNLAEDLTIPAGVVYYYRLTIKFESLDINQEKDREARLTTKFRLGDEVVELVLSASETTLARMGLKSQGAKDSFDTIATIDETADGLYSMPDDYGTSYYFRGAVTNNYVKFGGYYWRIIRINGDGSVRMQYDGTQAYPNANGGEGTGGSDRFTHTGQAWSSVNDDNKYVGWMYGGTKGSASTSAEQAQNNETNSDIKEVVDEWYKINLEDKNLGEYIGDEIFCNDRSMSETAQEWWTSEGTTNRGFGTTSTAYGAFSRFLMSDNTWNKTNPTPQFTCLQGNDMFTVNTQTINGKTTNGKNGKKIGLITADEVIAAGGLGEMANKNYFLFKNAGYWYWTFSPHGYDGGSAVYIIHAIGSFYSTHAYNSVGAVAPVINISADYAKTLIGNGTMTSPYQIPGVE